MKLITSLVVFSLLVSMVVAQQQNVQTLKDRVLVLNNGSVIHGKITKTRGGYLVESKGRKDAIPVGFVSFTAENMQQAYRFKRATLTEFTAKSHTELAEWCLKNHLIDDARAELKQALKIDINDKAARQLAVKLERHTKEDHTTENVKWTNDFQPRDGEAGKDVIPIGGLNRELATDFVTHVQPILINSCGNGSCHGGQSRKQFRLMHIPKRGSFRNRIEFNLEAVTSNFKNEASAMKSAMEKSDRFHRLHRTKGMTKKQIDIVANWANSVAKFREKNPANSNGDFVQLTSGIKREPSESEHSQLVNPQTDIVARVAAEEKPDPFDPNEFNRLHRRLPAQ